MTMNDRNAEKVCEVKRVFVKVMVVAKTPRKAVGGRL